MRAVKQIFKGIIMFSQSFAQLVKSNNGMFKSDKQAAFLTSKCNANMYSTSDEVFGNSYTMFYEIDSRGITKVIKHTRAKGDVVEWTRPVEGKLSAQDVKNIKWYKREIKSMETSIAKRIEAKLAGMYPDEEMFNSCQKEDAERLQHFKELLEMVPA